MNSLSQQLYQTYPTGAAFARLITHPDCYPVRAGSYYASSQRRVQQRSALKVLHWQRKNDYSRFFALHLLNDLLETGSNTSALPPRNRAESVEECP
ncbi:hypothetical protein EI42_01134 [Thermosporothrix hazakensis]|uniref:Uncharacterized protein n=1 Tax=Thermosporothrix hazakensis TaxID=644383 RepID=A0A326US66_THEHA|nr:hypothetical protein EI42_01134 [Thermosporothrix hazakensis]